METEKKHVKPEPYSKIVETFNSHIRGYVLQAEERGIRLTSNNSVHATLTLPKDATILQAHKWLTGFLAKAAMLVGVPTARLTNCGALFLQPVPHIHLAIRSPKTRISGCSIARMPPEASQALSQYWHRITGESAKFERIYNLAGLVRYWTGERNAGRKDQVFFTITSSL